MTQKVGVVGQKAGERPGGGPPPRIEARYSTFHPGPDASQPRNENFIGASSRRTTKSPDIT